MRPRTRLARAVGAERRKRRNEMRQVERLLFVSDGKSAMYVSVGVIDSLSRLVTCRAPGSCEDRSRLTPRIWLRLFGWCS